MNSIKIYAAGTYQTFYNRFFTGGWASIIVKDNERREIFGVENGVSLFRTELMACINSLELLKEEGNVPIIIYIDNDYIVNACRYRRYEKWKSNGWKNAYGTPVKHIDLWVKLVKLIKILNVIFNKADLRAIEDKKAKALAESAIDTYH